MNQRRPTIKSNLSGRAFWSPRWRKGERCGASIRMRRLILIDALHCFPLREHRQPLQPIKTLRPPTFRPEAQLQKPRHNGVVTLTVRVSGVCDDRGHIEGLYAKKGEYSTQCLAVVTAQFNVANEQHLFAGKVPIKIAQLAAIEASSPVAVDSVCLVSRVAPARVSAASQTPRLRQQREANGQPLLPASSLHIVVG